MNEELNFDSEFVSDEEVEEAIDCIINAIREEMLVDEDECAYITDPYKAQKLVYTYKVMKYLTKGTNAKVVYKVNQPYPSMGYVRVTGTNMRFRNAYWLSKAMEFASNFEAYPKTNGAVEMNFTFHDMTVRFEREDV